VAVENMLVNFEMEPSFVPDPMGTLDQAPKGHRKS